jgi:hypothetical protein
VRQMYDHEPTKETFTASSSTMLPSANVGSSDSTYNKGSSKCLDNESDNNNNNSHSISEY